MDVNLIHIVVVFLLFGSDGVMASLCNRNFKKNRLNVFLKRPETKKCFNRCRANTNFTFLCGLNDEKIWFYVDRKKTVCVCVLHLNYG